MNLRIMKSSEGGVWRTINGRHVFIRDGQSATEAMEESLGRDLSAALKEGGPADKRVAEIRGMLDGLSVVKLNQAFAKVKESARMTDAQLSKTEKAIADITKRRAAIDSKLKATEERIAKLREKKSAEAVMSELDALAKEAKALRDDYDAIMQECDREKSLLTRPSDGQHTGIKMKLRIVTKRTERKEAPSVTGAKLLRFDATFQACIPDAKKFVEVKNGEEIVDYKNVVLTGYLSTFQHVTKADRDGDYVVKGAFAETIPQFMKNPVLLVDHRNSVKTLAGRFTVVREDERGLYVEAAITNSPAPEMKDIRFKVAEGSLRTLSMGGAFHYAVDGKGIVKVTLWEGSLTPVPANPDAMFHTRTLTEAEHAKLME